LATHSKTENHRRKTSGTRGFSRNEKEVAHALFTNDLACFARGNLVRLRVRTRIRIRNTVRTRQPSTGRNPLTRSSSASPALNSPLCLRLAERQVEEKIITDLMAAAGVMNAWLCNEIVSTTPGSKSGYLRLPLHKMTFRLGNHTTVDPIMSFTECCHQTWCLSCG
jgi:hypothetical protein